tara:strand:- start:851 stop:1081 length:231 start_codon:yes stop_codon:yes gene_type:complete
MNKSEELKILNKLYSTESGLNTRIWEISEYPPAQKIADEMFALNDKLNSLINKRLKELGVKGEYPITPIDPSHMKF